MDPWLLCFTELADQRTAVGLSVGCKLSHSRACSVPGHREGPPPSPQTAALGELFPPSFPASSSSFAPVCVSGPRGPGLSSLFSDLRAVLS